MTEESYQQARKVMVVANSRRGYITIAKGNVAKWSRIEDAYRQDGKESQAEGAKKMLAKALEKLDEMRKKFADLKFPDSDIENVYTQMTQCDICGALIKKGNTYCDECLEK